jgi:hypothetical protein
MLLLVAAHAHAGYAIELERDNLLLFLFELLGLALAYKISLAFVPCLAALGFSSLALFATQRYLRRHPGSKDAFGAKITLSRLFTLSLVSTIGTAPFAAGSAYLKNENRLANEAELEEAKVLAPAAAPKPSADSTWKLYSPLRAPWPEAEGLLAPEPPEPSGSPAYAIAFSKANDGRPVLAKLCKAANGPCEALGYSYHFNKLRGSFHHLAPGYYEIRTIDLSTGKAWRGSTHQIEIEAGIGQLDQATGERLLLISIDPAARSGQDIDFSEF